MRTLLQRKQLNGQQQLRLNEIYGIFKNKVQMAKCEIQISSDRFQILLVIDVFSC